MFSLTDEDLRGRIVGCGDGPASFNAEAAGRGTHVLSCDPLYQFDAGQIRTRIESTCEEILEQTRRNRRAFVWREIADVEELGRLRMAAMEAFLADYEAGRREGRYIAAALPDLPFPDRSFDLALCSHLLFLYTTQLSEAFHHQAIAEMCRVANEGRIFPLLSLGGTPSPYVEGALQAVKCPGWTACVEQVPYEFQRGGTQMLRLRKNRG